MTRPVSSKSKPFLLAIFNTSSKSGSRASAIIVSRRLKSRLMRELRIAFDFVILSNPLRFLFTRLNIDIRYDCFRSEYYSIMERVYIRSVDLLYEITYVVA